VFSKNIICGFRLNEKAVGALNNTNICWDCKHNKLKLKILVPQNCTIKEYIHKMGNFQTDIVAINKGKKGQYHVWYRFEGTLNLLSFKMLHACKLNQGQEKNEEEVGACENYDVIANPNLISSIIYSKVSLPEQLKKKLAEKSKAEFCVFKN
jgi:hypothetical protein